MHAVPPDPYDARSCEFARSMLVLAMARCLLCSALLGACIAMLPAADASLELVHGTLDQHYFAQARQLSAVGCPLTVQRHCHSHSGADKRKCESRSHTQTAC